MLRALAVLALVIALQGASATSADAAVQTCGGVTATLRGTEAADVLVGTSGRDVIVGLGGGDRIAGRGGNDLICGGSGSDRIEGGKGRDRVLAGPGEDRLNGGPGNDRVNGEDGSDQVRGGAGDDVVRTGSVAPRNGYSDYVYIDGGADTLIGGHELVVLDGTLASRPVVIDIPAGTVRGMGIDTVVGRFYHLQGSNYDDVLVGGDLDEVIDGGLGRDVVNAGGGADWLVGDRWNADRLYGEHGNDYVAAQVKGARADGGSGSDSIITSNGAAGSGGPGDDVLIPSGSGTQSGDEGVDTMLLSAAESGVRASLVDGAVGGGLAFRFAGIENVGGSHFDDVLIGDDVANFIDGGPGQDVVHGGAGDDILVGQTGPDTFYGDLGYDLCGPGTRYSCEDESDQMLF